MGWEDRPYYRDRDDTAGRRLLWLFNGSVPVFTIFGIRVRAHASLIITILLVLAFETGLPWQMRVQSMAILFFVVLLHEFGHCFAARWMGGSADHILMTPLGGLATASPPHRWFPNLVTVAAGPAVNVLICIFCGAALWASVGVSPTSLGRVFSAVNHAYIFSWLNLNLYLFWIFAVSLGLLLFNLLPIFPLDGGQMLQSVLWWKFGYFKATVWACVVGMVGSVLLLMAGIASHNWWWGLIAISCFAECMNKRWQMLSVGPEEYADSIDYSAAYEPATPRRRSRLSRRAVAKARKAVQEARLEQVRIDQILAKVSAHGMASLNWSERRALRKATEQRRKRDLELSR